MSWKSEVITNREANNWIGNRLRFATLEEALSYVGDLAGRWSMVSDTRVVQCDDPVNYRYLDGQLLIVVPLLVPDNDMGEVA